MKQIRKANGSLSRETLNGQNRCSISDRRELANHPDPARPAGTATVLAGTGAFIAQVSMPQEIAAAPGADQSSAT
jgi:hypothetical protein